MKVETLRSLGVFVAGYCTFVNLYTPQAFLPALAADLGTTPTQVGLCITVTLLAGITGSASGGMSIALAAMSDSFIRSSASTPWSG